jgi:hypothetical protein
MIRDYRVATPAAIDRVADPVAGTNPLVARAARDRSFPSPATIRSPPRPPLMVVIAAAAVDLVRATVAADPIVA